VRVVGREGCSLRDGIYDRLCLSYKLCIVCGVQRVELWSIVYAFAAVGGVSNWLYGICVPFYPFYTLYNVCDEQRVASSSTKVTGAVMDHTNDHDIYDLSFPFGISCIPRDAS